MAYGLFGPVNPQDYTLFGVEPGAVRDRSPVRKLAAYSGALALSTSTVELPTGLVIYPSFKADSSIEIFFFCSLVNATGVASVVTLALKANGTTVATITSTSLTSVLGDSTVGYLAVLLKIVASTSTAQTITGFEISRSPDPAPSIASGATANIAGILNTSAIDFSLTDVELRLDVTLGQGTGTLKHYHMLQHTPREGW